EILRFTQNDSTQSPISSLHDVDIFDNLWWKFATPAARKDDIAYRHSERSEESHKGRDSSFHSE
ncbi:hypothetical protein, partial [Seleniivibrio woodruffii]|uniref:hypothetical protein n=1 Tax=Seleniivibrio woodruffii TaxID=1078050 RepID=UPI0039E60BEB